MYILGDIGNSETKLFLVNSKNRIIKYKSFPSKEMNTNICVVFIAKVIFKLTLISEHKVTSFSFWILKCIKKS